MICFLNVASELAIKEEKYLFLSISHSASPERFVLTELPFWEFRSDLFRQVNDVER